MIANVNVALAFTEIFGAVKFIPDKRELTKDPTPYIKEKIPDSSRLHAEEKREH